MAKKNNSLEQWAKNHRTHWLPVENPRHTEVLGCRLSTKYGKLNWDALDWSNWWLDGKSPHLFNAGGTYFHVQCRADSNHADCVFRVRCWYAGEKFKGWPVKDIDVGMKNGKLHWIVQCERPS